MRKNLWFSLVSILLLTLILAACGDNNASSNNDSSNNDANNEASNNNDSNENDSNENENDANNSEEAGEVMTRINESNTIKVGFEGTYPPFNYQDDDGEFTGFDVDISNEIASRLGVEAEFVTSKWAGLIGGLNADKFDVIIAQMTVTEERKESVDFTDPYIVTGAVIVTHNDTDAITSLDELNGKKVGAAAGTSFAELAETAEGADVNLYEGGFATYVNDVVNKRLDALVNDSLVMGYNIMESGHPIKISSELLSRDENAMAVKKGNEDFIEKVNEAIAGMKDDGTYNEIYKKWFDMDPLE